MSKDVSNSEVRRLLAVIRSAAKVIDRSSEVLASMTEFDTPTPADRARMDLIVETDLILDELTKFLKEYEWLEAEAN